MSLGSTSPATVAHSLQDVSLREGLREFTESTEPQSNQPLSATNSAYSKATRGHLRGGATALPSLQANRGGYRGGSASRASSCTRHGKFPQNSALAPVVGPLGQHNSCLGGDRLEFLREAAGQFVVPAKLADVARVGGNVVSQNLGDGLPAGISAMSAEFAANHRASAIVGASGRWGFLSP